MRDRTCQDKGSQYRRRTLGQVSSGAMRSVARQFVVQTGRRMGSSHFAVRRADGQED